MKFLVINGPNINMLGIREPHIYGGENYAELLRRVREKASELNVEVECFQSNHEGDIIDKIQSAYKTADGIIINPAGYTHTSVAILDALKAVNIKTVEVHISDVGSREDYRQISYVREVAFATICGKGIDGYIEALELLKSECEKN